MRKAIDNLTSAQDQMPFIHLQDHKPPQPNVFTWESVTDIELSLAQLSDHEATVAARLDALVAGQRDLARELGRLDLLRAQIGTQAVSTRTISNGILLNASLTATRISSAVKKLDLEQARVESTLDVVDQVAELKSCVLGVTGSMGAPQDWETAAGYLNRASKIPKEIVDGAFAEQIVPTAEVPDPPGVTLEQAAESLRALFLREFEKAAQEGNGSKVTRFFKLFPLIGKPDDGLDVYGRYVCQGVASRARSNLNAGSGGHQRQDGFFYANALTKLFEHIAQIVEHHGGLVERHYGVGRMVRVIERLQLEADVQGGIVLDTWSDERNIDRRLTDIRSYAFTFLVQSFLPIQAARSSTPRASSPAKKGAASEAQTSDDGSVDMKEIDGFLGEIAVMLGRWSLYSSFIAAKCRDAESGDDELRVPPLISDSSLRRKIADRLVTPFNAMTTFFFRRSVEKAFQLDEQPPDLTLDRNKPLSSSGPYITSAVDDVMYIVHQVIERSLATSQRPVISSVVPTIARVLSSDFIGMIQRKMRDESYPKAAVQGALPPEQTTIAFLVLINNLDVAIDYVKRIVSSRVEISGAGENSSLKVLSTQFPLDHDAATVARTLKSLQSSFDAKASELIGDGIFVVFKNIVKPRLRPLLADAFREVDYQMTQEELEEAKRIAVAEHGNGSRPNSTVQDHFQEGWEGLTKPISRLLTERNFEKLLALMIAYLGEVLEKRIWSYYGRLDELGAARLERDIASIVSVVVRGGKYGLRDSFARCTQVCLVMNMEDEEWEELEASLAQSKNDDEWIINADERARARAILTGVGVLLEAFSSLKVGRDQAASVSGRKGRPVRRLEGTLQSFDSEVSHLCIDIKDSKGALAMGLKNEPAPTPPSARNTEILQVDVSKIGSFVFKGLNQSFLEDWTLHMAPECPDAANLKQAALQLRVSDFPVAFPTETVYGLGADATRSSAVRGIYRAKQRPSDNPLIVHVSSLGQLRQLLTGADHPQNLSGSSQDPIPSIYLPLISRFWPGPLTILIPLPIPSPFAPEVTTNLPTVGVRMPSSLLALALIHMAGIPLAAPSANASSKPSPTTAAHVLHDLSGRIDTIIDGGPCQVGVESTVVDGLTDPPLILRPGAVSLEMLRKCEGWEDVRVGYADGAETSTPRAPGMKYKHYSPKARVVLVHGQLDFPTIRQFVTPGHNFGVLRTKKWSQRLLPLEGKSFGTLHQKDVEDEVIEKDETKGPIPESADTDPISVAGAQSSQIQIDPGQDQTKVWTIALGRDAITIARMLFSALRELDLKGVDVIFVEAIDDREGHSAAAVMNRLRKAAETEIEIKM